MITAPIDRTRHDWLAAWSRHCHRAVGASGIRRVRIEVLTAGVTILTYVIDHLWRLDDGEIRSLLRLSEPRGLAGTAVLMIERRGDASATEIYIKLSTARQPIAVEPQRAGERVLGTDFTYEDLRFWLPYARPDDADALPGDPARDAARFEARRRRGGQSYDVALGFEPESGALIDYVERDGKTIRKLWSVDRWTRFGAIFSPTRLRIERDAGAFRSIMTLEAVRFDVTVAPGLLRPDALTDLSPAHYAEALRQLEADDLLAGRLNLYA